MTVELTGADLTLDEVVRVARARETVALADEALVRMRERRAVVERVARDGTPTYGVTTGVGMRRGATVDTKDARAFNRSAIFGHLVGLGEPAPEDVVRASLLRLANAVASGHQGGRPEVADALIEALNAGESLVVRSLGTVGQADLAQNADLAHGALQDVQLEAGEAIALLVSNAFSTGQSALAVADARSLLDWIDARRGTRLRGVPRERRRAALRGRGRPPVPGDRRDAHTDARSARRQRAVGTRRRALPPGPAHLPLRAAGARSRTRCPPLRPGAARDRAERAPGQPTRRAGRATARLGRELRLAAARGRTRLSPHRARSRAHGRRRANAEASEPALQRAERRTRRERGLVAGRALRARRGGAGHRGRGAPPGAAGLLRARVDDAGVGRRGPHGPVVARRAASDRDARPRGSGHGRRADGRGAGGRPPRGRAPGTGAALVHGFVRERIPRLESYEQMPLPLEDLATEIRTLPAPA